MNSVCVSGRLLERRDTTHRGVPQVRLRVYNDDAAETFEAMVYGRRRVGALPADMIDGAEIVIEGRLMTFYWRTPNTGKKVRQVGIEVFRVSLKERPEANMYDQHEAPTALVTTATDQ